MWTVCITSISHVLKLNGYGGPQAKVNEKNQGFKGWETLDVLLLFDTMICFFGQAERNPCKQLALMLAPRSHPSRGQRVGSCGYLFLKIELIPNGELEHAVASVAPPCAVGNVV